MNCPVCKDPALLMTERQGVESDYCPGSQDSGTRKKSGLFGDLLGGLGG